MHIFFDVDYTILAGNGALRPLVKETFAQLKADGFSLYIWSGVGIRWREVREHCLEPYILGCYEKPLQDYERMVQLMLERRELPVAPDLIIDDYPEIVSRLGGVVVRPYYLVNENDREMERVYKIITEWVRSGHSTDPAYRPRFVRDLRASDGHPNPSL
ncbi:MAG: HAD family hydrolase [Chloroflexi bacterium]|nr:HAD family hydrolase [Chloroflexota bacterium]